MKLELHYFASIRERIGIAHEQFELADPISVGALVERLKQTDDRYAALDGSAVPVRFAVNREFADAARILEDGDEVAFLPPITGG